MCKQLLISIDYTFFKKNPPQLFINIHFHSLCRSLQYLLLWCTVVKQREVTVYLLFLLFCKSYSYQIMALDLYRCIDKLYFLFSFVNIIYVQTIILFHTNGIKLKWLQDKTTLTLKECH